MNIRTVRKKIKSVGNVKKITKAMQMVSAIKMKKSQQLAIESAPYAQFLEKMIYRALSTTDSSSSSLISNKSTSSKNLYIIISSNKGLCGAFNFNLFKYINKEVDINQHDFITVGKKVSSFLTKRGAKIIADFTSTNPQTSISAIFKQSLDLFLGNHYQKVILIYNKFINTLKFETYQTVLLPARLDKKSNDDQLMVKKEYLIEPSPEQIIDSILRDLVEEKIRVALLDSDASEHSSRMIAMKNATENATDVIYNLTLLRNKIRQEKITYELLDMITAKESVEN